ncbi:hypothetical protein [Candidatus Methylomicrobium oryzae]|uniref:hypothetical protein n=1 Tax=Candidatus Methylomicrobium oryzae TaxID=2802053 RepID=UPI001922A226|nr:hypothetical protein [Methylomicrobium sp. RS1]MBL1262681.1 hypothetical protein [Methylomicrobium sp. RS1]
MTFRIFGTILLSTFFTMPVLADDYCVVCPDRSREKCESPSWCGGECGVIYCGASNPNCSVSYYDGRTCKETSRFQADLQASQMTKKSINSSDQQEIKITMKKYEWNNLLAEIERSEKPTTNCFLKDTIGGNKCKYALSVYRVNQNRGDKDLFDLPTEIVMQGFRILLPVIGEEAYNSYSSEGNEVFKLNTHSAKGFDNYIYCRHETIRHSLNKVRADWSYIGDKGGTFAWRFDPKAWFDGRGWVSVDIAWITVHPNFAAQARSEGKCWTAPGNLPPPF